MKEILIACGDVELLKQLVADLPADHYKPIATKRGAGIAAKIAARQLPLAIIHEALEDGASQTLVSELRASSPHTAILWLSQGPPAPDAPGDRALQYPLPGPVLRHALSRLAPAAAQGQDMAQWRAFYDEVKARHGALPTQDYYTILGVPRQAPHHILVSAFDQLSLRFHPDRYQQHRHERWGEAVWQEVNAVYKVMTEAYSVVTDRRMAPLYERALAEGALRLDPEASARRDSGPRSLEELSQNANAKKYLKLAQVSLASQDLPGAIQHLQFALSMEPGNSAIQAKLDALRRG